MTPQEFASELRTTFGKPSNRTVNEFDQYCRRIIAEASKHSDDAIKNALAVIEANTQRRSAFPPLTEIQMALAKFDIKPVQGQSNDLRYKTIFNTPQGQDAIKGAYAADFYQYACNIKRVPDSGEGNMVKLATLKARLWIGENIDRIRNCKVLPSGCQTFLDPLKREELFQKKIHPYLGRG